MKFHCVIIAIISGCGGAAAALPPGIPDDPLVASILARDPQRALMASDLTAEWLDSKAENRLENPELGFDHYWGSRQIGNKYTVSISQAFDWPGLYGMRSRVVERRRAASNVAIEAFDAERMLDVWQLLADYGYCVKSLELARSTEQYADSLVAYTEMAAARGEVTVVDLNKIRLERLSAVKASRQAVTALDEAARLLAEVNGGVPVDPEALSMVDFTWLSAPLGDIQPYLEAISLSAAARARREGVSACRSTLDVASRSERLPGFSLGYSYNNEFGDSFHGIIGSVTLPVYSGGSSVRAARRRYDAAVEADFAAARTDSADVRSYYAQVAALDDEIRAYDKAAGATIAELSAQLNEMVAAGLLTHIAYLQEQQYLVTLVKEALDSRHDRATAYIGLRRASGW